MPRSRMRHDLSFGEPPCFDVPEYRLRVDVEYDARTGRVRGALVDPLTERTVWREPGNGRYPNERGRILALQAAQDERTAREES